MANIYMKITGISGNASAQGYEGWIQIDSLQFNTSRHIQTQTGKVHDRINGWPEFAQVIITKQLDDATSALFNSACSAKVLPQVDIAVCTSGASPQTYVQYTLSNVLISDYGHAVNHNNKPIEALYLDYTKIEMSYRYTSTLKACDIDHDKFEGIVTWRRLSDFTIKQKASCQSLRFKILTGCRYFS
jgi:type VI secretion system secreted protein Hcp